MLMMLTKSLLLVLILFEGVACVSVVYNGEYNNYTQSTLLFYVLLQTMI